MRLALALAAAIGLSACDNAPTGSQPDGPVASGGPVGENAAGATPPVASAQAGDLPEPSEGLRFVGRWASDNRSCETAAWIFTETTLQTPRGAACSFTRVTPVPGGYDVQATCTAQGPPESDTLEIRFAESADAMLFRSESVEDSRLIFCGREV